MALSLFVLFIYSLGKNKYFVNVFFLISDQLTKENFCLFSPKEGPIRRKHSHLSQSRRILLNINSLRLFYHFLYPTTQLFLLRWDVFYFFLLDFSLCLLIPVPVPDFSFRPNLRNRPLQLSFLD